MTQNLFGSLRFKNKEIERIAFSILKESCEGDIKVPVSIELVAELSGYIDEIGMLEGLSEKFNVAAALCPNPTSQLIIIVDRDEFDHCSVRSRFSVAHELGHAVMHSDVYKSTKKYTVDEAVRVNQKIQKRYTALERDANYFAGAILMPYEHFTANVFKLYRILAKEYEFDFKRLKNVIAAHLARIFNVSSHAASYRLNDIGLDAYIRRAAKNKIEDLKMQMLFE